MTEKERESFYDAARAVISQYFAHSSLDCLFPIHAECNDKGIPLEIWQLAAASFDIITKLSITKSWLSLVRY